MSWADGALVGFDTETTGTDPEQVYAMTHLDADIQDVAAAGAKEYFHGLNEARQNVLGHEIKSGSGKSPAMDAAGAAA